MFTSHITLKKDQSIPSKALYNAGHISLFEIIRLLIYIWSKVHVSGHKESWFDNKCRVVNILKYIGESRCGIFHIPRLKEQDLICGQMN